MLTATAPPASFGLSLTEPAGACAAGAASQAIAVLLDRRNIDLSTSDSSSCSKSVVGGGGYIVVFFKFSKFFQVFQSLN